METENPDWQPDGPRWLEKVQCEKCSGVGFLISEIEEACAMCNGVGFIESSVNDVILCPECQGERKTTLEIKTGCNDCNGRGYHPKIMQRFEATLECPTCKGTGEIEVDNDEYEDCETCEGSGRDQHSEYCSLPKWRSSPLNTGSGHKVAWSGDDLTDEYQLDSGAFVDIVLCEECVKPLGAEIPSEELFRAGCGIDFYRTRTVGLEEDENDETPDNNENEDEYGGEDDALEEETCPVCEGLRKVVRITGKCGDCDGSGMVEVTTTEECPECDGDGKLYLSEEREV